MNLFNLNPLANLRRRLGAVLGAFAFSAVCCLGGALMAFVLAPGQALQAYHIAHLPAMDAATVAAAQVNAELLITGLVSGTAPAPQAVDLIAYTDEQWQVSAPTNSNSNSNSSSTAEPSGEWQTIKTVVPDLTLNLDGQAVPIQAASSAELGGPLHEVIVKSDASLTADDEGQPLPDGTHRYRGLSNGDLTTVWGHKAASGGVIPRYLFLGDRAAFETSQNQATSGLLLAGLCAMGAAPLVLIGGLLGAMFWRRR